MLEDYDYKIAPGYTIDDYKKLNLRVDSDENTWEGESY